MVESEATLQWFRLARSSFIFQVSGKGYKIIGTSLKEPKYEFSATQLQERFLHALRDNSLSSLECHSYIE
jgi:hypothetical protein